jgi:NAD(P)-dependent dehydrogenase (short-subunit alcohol dehydrogenase family)
VTETGETTVWITGATSGIGAALARACPHPRAEIVNASRRPHPDYRSIAIDLTRADTWHALIDDFHERLQSFAGRRAIFIHNGFHHRRAFIGEGEPTEQAAEVTANVVAPLVLGDAFVRASRDACVAGVEVGLVQISSGAARLAYPGLGVYGAGKAAMEQWVRTARAEFAHRGRGPWIVAVRPGFVDTPSARKDAAQPPSEFPAAPALAESLATGKGVLDADDVARAIWDALPPTGDRTVLFFGEAVGAS